MQQASLLYYSAKPQSGGILGCALRHCTSEPTFSLSKIRFPPFSRSLASVKTYSQYPAWSHCRRSADIPRADHDRVGWSPWQGGFNLRSDILRMPFFHLLGFSTSQNAATAFVFQHKKTIEVTFLGQNNSLPLLLIQSRQNMQPPKLEIRPETKKRHPKKRLGHRGWNKESFLKNWAQSDQKSIF